MPYALKLYLYLGVWFVVVTILAARWLPDLSTPFILTFGIAYGCLMIVVGRWFFGRKTL